MVSLFSRSVGVGWCFPEKVGGRCFFKALCTANAATNAVPGTALMLGLASSLPPHTRSLEEGEGMGGGIFNVSVLVLNITSKKFVSRHSCENFRRFWCRFCFHIRTRSFLLFSVSDHNVSFMAVLQLQGLSLSSYITGRHSLQTMWMWVDFW